MAPPGGAFWCILSSKIAPGGNIFGYLSYLEMVHFTNAISKNSSIGKKCRNGVSKADYRRVSTAVRGMFNPIN